MEDTKSILNPSKNNPDITWDMACSIQLEKTIIALKKTILKKVINPIFKYPPTFST